MHQILRQELIVVLHKGDAPSKSLVLGNIEDLLQELLALLVVLVSFAGKDDLHRPIGIIYDLCQTGNIMQEERGPFVGGEAPGKT